MQYNERCDVLNVRYILKESAHTIYLMLMDVKVGGAHDCDSELVE